MVILIHNIQLPFYYFILRRFTKKLYANLDAKERLKEKASGAKESVQETGSQLSDKAYGNIHT